MVNAGQTAMSQSARDKGSIPKGSWSGGKLFEKDGPRGDVIRGGQLVWAISGGFDLRQALGSRGQMRHDGVNGQRVPCGRGSVG